MASLLPSVRVLAKSALTCSQLLLLSSSNTVLGGSPPSCSNPQTSCQNTSAVANTCCFNAPGGQLLQTQFWDANPATGPADSWTIHGLWPDHCDGTYDANCDPNRAYTNISTILSSAGQTDLLSYMNTYWKDESGNDESFWDHEWEKHGTCISTLQPSCYTGYTPQEEVIDYFAKAVALFKTLPSYTWLSDAGIVPSTSATYTSGDVLAALKAPRGVEPVIQCANTNELDEIWYFYDVQGTVQTGNFIPTPPDGSKSSCPATGIKYLPKGTTSPTNPPTTTTPPSTTPTGTPFTGKGTLQVTNSGSPSGCIISGGTWYIGGTCAGFTATPSANGTGFTLTSSKGKCAVQSGSLTCASGVMTATVFGADGEDLAYMGSASWYAASVPAGGAQVTVSSTKLAQAIEITWKGA